jgi:hypothetical protein
VRDSVLCSYNCENYVLGFPAYGLSYFLRDQTVAPMLQLVLHSSYVCLGQYNEGKLIFAICNAAKEEHSKAVVIAPKSK